MSEDQILKACISWVRKMRPFDLIFHIPNERERATTLAQQMNAIAKGLFAGIPDLYFVKAKSPYHGLFIEVKMPKKGLTPKQKLVKKVIEREGYLYKIIYSLEDFKKEIENYAGI